MEYSAARTAMIENMLIATPIIDNEARNLLLSKAFNVKQKLSLQALSEQS